MINPETERIAKIVSPEDSNLIACAEDIKNGRLVAFPTETVYGLGANALNIEAVKKIFEYKGRPLSDPLIVHVTSLPMALSLVDIDQKTENLFKILISKYWPGPLTVILKANYQVLNPIITANTGYVGIRYPNHEIAAKLITYSNLPIAAPSANKFCHISPVNPNHVYEDFKEFPIKIIDGGITNFCMESTVVKIVNDEKKLLVFRMGAISPQELQTFLLGTDEYKDFTVETIAKKTSQTNHEGKNEFQEEQEAPGQFIKHYSPTIDTYVINENKEEPNYYSLHKEELFSTVLLDFNGKILARTGKIFGYYRDLSETGNEDEVMHNLYSFLRWGEAQENAKKIIICDLETHMKANQHLNTFVDRIKKASSSRKIVIDKVYF